MGATLGWCSGMGGAVLGMTALMAVADPLPPSATYRPLPSLPLGVVKILLAALVEAGHLVTRPPVQRAPLADRDILEEVLNGLRAKFG